MRHGFVEYAGGDWEMPPKVYLDAPPNGDFRAMPAKGGGHGDPQVGHLVPAATREAGLPVVMGMICVSSADDGEPLALVDVRAVTALRTGAVAAVAAQELAREDAAASGIVGCGLHGAWAARCLAAAEYGPGVCFDPDPEAAGRAGRRAGLGGRQPRGGAGVRRRHLRHARRRAGGARGRPAPGRSTSTCSAPTARARPRPSVARGGRRPSSSATSGQQASHGGELTGAVEAGLVGRDDVRELGAVLTGAAPGRSGDGAVTLFDSTGLAIQDLAICLALLDAHTAGRVRAGSLRL